MPTCNCEHVAHFRHSTGTPHGRPGHLYQEEFADHDLFTIPSDLGGVIRVCADCATDCHCNGLSEALRAVLFVTRPHLFHQ